MGQKTTGRCNGDVECLPLVACQYDGLVKE